MSKPVYASPATGCGYCSRGDRSPYCYCLRDCGTRVASSWTEHDCPWSQPFTGEAPPGTPALHEKIRRMGL